MAYVEIDLEDFTDDEILDEALKRGLTKHLHEDDPLPPCLQKQVDEYRNAKVIGPKELGKYLEWARQ